MSKIKVGVIFGGMSTEHDVSIVSGTSIAKNIDKNKYEVLPIYIDSNGNWFECFNISKKYEVGDKIENASKIDNLMEYLKKLDVIFPVLHGLYGEDGTVQGLFELLKILKTNYSLQIQFQLQTPDLGMTEFSIYPQPSILKNNKDLKTKSLKR